MCSEKVKLITTNYNVRQMHPNLSEGVSNTITGTSLLTCKQVCVQATIASIGEASFSPKNLGGPEAPKTLRLFGD